MRLKPDEIKADDLGERNGHERRSPEGCPAGFQPAVEFGRFEDEKFGCGLAYVHRGVKPPVRRAEGPRCDSLGWSEQSERRPRLLDPNPPKPCKGVTLMDQSLAKIEMPT